MTGTAPQRPKADPQMVTCFQCRGDGTCFATDDPCPVCGGLGSITDDAAPVPQTEGEAILNRHQDKAVKESAIYKAMTEGECPDCGGTGRIRRQKDWRIDPCSFCSGTGKEGEK